MTTHRRPGAGPRRVGARPRPRGRRGRRGLVGRRRGGRGRARRRRVHPHPAQGRDPPARRPGPRLGGRPDPPRRDGLRRLRELPVRLPARDQAVRDPRPPGPRGRGGRPDRARRRGHAGPDRARSCRRRGGDRAADGRRLTVRAGRSVVMAAGALRTPAILQASRAEPSRDRPAPAAPSGPGPRGLVQRAGRDVARHDAGARARCEFVERTSRAGTATSSSRRRAIPGSSRWRCRGRGPRAHARVMAQLRIVAPLIAVTRDGGEGRLDR